MREPIYYVYFHLKPGTTEVYYVGVGHGTRAFSFRPPRNPFWDAVYRKHGVDVVLVHEGLSLDQAFELERLYIQEIGRRDLNRGTLTNLTDGGDGLVNPSIETRHRMSESARLSGRKRFADPAEREKAKQRAKQMWADLDPQERENRNMAVRDSFTPEVRAKIVDKIKIHYESDDNRDLQSKRMKRSWDSDPGRKAAMSARSTEYWKDECHRQEQSSKMKEFYSIEDNRKMTAEHTKAQWRDPTIRKRRSSGIKKRWQSPEYRAKISAKMKAYWERKRTDKP